MSAYLIAERYAKALSASIHDAAALDPAQEALAELAELLREHHDFRTMVTNPAIAVERRITALDDVLKRTHVPDAVAGLMRVMLRRGRITELPRVATFFHELVDSRLNRVTADVTTAISLNADDVARLQQSLSTFSGRDIRMAMHIDPAIVGGVVARIGDTVLDGSLRTRLARLKQSVVSHDMV